MAIVFTNTGRNATLSYLVNDAAPESLILRLYSNDVTPDPSDVVATYTEVVGGGYSSITLTPASWSIAGGIASYPPQTWSFTAAVGDVYGYYITRQAAGDLVFAERFSGGPYDVQTVGDTISVTLNLAII